MHLHSPDILNRILRQIDTNCIIGGDLNAWSTIWGAAQSNQRGLEVEDMLLSSNLICLNNGTATHLSTHNTFTCIDLTFCSAALAPKCSWQVLDFLYGSDRFPILTQVNTQGNQNQYKHCSKFKTDAADWKKFSARCTQLCRNSPAANNPNQEAAKILKIIRTAAHYEVPQTKPIRYQKRITWWNANLSYLRSHKQQAWHNFKRTRSDQNLLTYKIANAIFKRAAKLAKKEEFEKFTSNINPTLNPKTIWNDIKKLTGVQKQTNFSCIASLNGPINAPLDIANFFGSSLSLASCDVNFHNTFRELKAKRLQKRTAGSAAAFTIRQAN
ncbi:uncharacterized protein LOC118734261 [Rhagoletis pomonella]|uniref:uncharacterized protein LOC118734261 n=1 Tax=Rhagoletis pomonella TaxID=28610 RepID=UPI0017871F09|nr:uncharacterized protein LOC118734261 [Rhagoletis pomonella]